MNNVKQRVHTKSLTFLFWKFQKARNSPAFTKYWEITFPEADSTHDPLAQKSDPLPSRKVPNQRPSSLIPTLSVAMNFTPPPRLREAFVSAAKFSAFGVMRVAPTVPTAKGLTRPSLSPYVPPR